MASMLDLLYPRHCPLCDRLLPYAGARACPECLRRLKRVEAPQCFTCGKTVESAETEYCEDCKTRPKSYIRGFPVFDYTGDIKPALYSFKYSNQRDYGSFFAACIVQYYGPQLRALEIDGLVPVPLHPGKQRSRGYNQAAVLARELGRSLELPVYPDYLRRVVRTNPQKELNAAQRTKNLKSAFKIGKNKIKLNKILLVDDIYTTGATIEACAQVLLAAGAESVYYTSVAIGEGCA
jgi:ComF family protein